MTVTNSQKLIKTSLTIRSILRILLGLLLLEILIPWLIPTTTMAKFLLSMQGFFGVIDRFQQSNIDSFMANLTWLERVVGVLGSVVVVFPLVCGCLIMLRVVNNYLHDKVFSIKNAKLYRSLGVVYLLSALFLQPISQMLFSLCATLNNPVGQRTIAFSLGIENLNAIFFALVLIVIGQVMQMGHKINVEQELTI